MSDDVVVVKRNSSFALGATTQHGSSRKLKDKRANYVRPH
jgi:hypothetical protein